MRYDGSRLQDRVNEWLLRVGKWRVVAAITAVSTVLSVFMTGFGNIVFMPEVPWEEGFYISLIVPVLISPIVSTMVLSLLYQLAEAKAALARMSETDPLTGVGNRRLFFSAAAPLLAAASQKGEPASIVLIDIDHFKRVNDTYGHAIGDATLIAVAGACTEALRAQDVFCRWGGEEFIALLPSASLHSACSIAERLRRNIESLAIAGVAEGVTVSIGVAEVRDFAAPIDAAIALADRQLYRAKEGGRNRVEPALASGPEPHSGFVSGSVRRLAG